jgi:hypothetical protein
LIEVSLSVYTLFVSVGIVVRVKLAVEVSIGTAANLLRSNYYQRISDSRQPTKATGCL